MISFAALPCLANSAYEPNTVSIGTPNSAAIPYALCLNPPILEPSGKNFLSSSIWSCIATAWRIASVNCCIVDVIAKNDI